MLSHRSCEWMNRRFGRWFRCDDVVRVSGSIKNSASRFRLHRFVAYGTNRATLHCARLAGRRLLLPLFGFDVGRSFRRSRRAFYCRHSDGRRSRLDVFVSARRRGTIVCGRSSLAAGLFSRTRHVSTASVFSPDRGGRRCGCWDYPVGLDFETLPLAYALTSAGGAV